MTCNDSDRRYHEATVTTGVSRWVRFLHQEAETRRDVMATGTADYASTERGKKIKGKRSDIGARVKGDDR